MKKDSQANKLFDQFEIGLYEKALKNNPNDVGILITLGYAYTKTGLHEKALEVDKKLASLLPEDVIVHYNLACTYSNLNMINESLNALEIAILLGYHDFKHMEKDPDLANLRKSPRYQQILAKMKNRHIT